MPPERYSGLTEYGGSDDDGDGDGDSPPYDVCIHAAAMSSPRACQDDPVRAYALNCPEKFLRAVRDVSLLVVLSTDQVYDGRSEALYGEDVLADATEPPNVYAKSKVLLERRVRELRADDARLRTVVLRSSIVVGPRDPVCDDAHETFFHFCAFRDGKPTDLWVNEWRSIVSVSHVCDRLQEGLRLRPSGRFRRLQPGRAREGEPARRRAGRLRALWLRSLLPPADGADVPERAARHLHGFVQA